MDQKTFSIVAGVIFAAVALFHLVRIYMDWPVMIGVGTDVGELDRPRRRGRLELLWAESRHAQLNPSPRSSALGSWSKGSSPK